MLTLNSQNRCKTEIDTDVEKRAIMHMRLKKLIKDNLKSISRGTITIYFIIVIICALIFKKSLNGRLWLFIVPAISLLAHISNRVNNQIKKKSVVERVVDKKMQTTFFDLLNQMLFAIFVCAVYPNFGKVLLGLVIMISYPRYVFKSLGIDKIQKFICIAGFMFMCWLDINKLTILTTIVTILMYVLNFENFKILVKLFFNIEISKNLQNKQKLAKYNFTIVIIIFVIILTAYITDCYSQSLFEVIYFRLFKRDSSLCDTVIKFCGKGIDKIFIAEIILLTITIIYKTNKEQIKGLIKRTFVSKIDDKRE